MNGAVVFVGVGIFPHRVAGDKNFLLQLAEHLGSHQIPTRFVSIVSSSAGLHAPDGFTFVSRFMHRTSGSHFRKDNNGNVIGYRHSHGALRSGMELSATLVRAGGTIRRVLAEHDRAVVHWVDSSVLVPSLRIVCGERHRYVASMLRYLPQGRVGTAARTFALRRAHRVFTGSQAARELLVRDGCCVDRVLVAPWGCAARCEPEDRLDGGPVRLLWSGFLQQIGREDLLSTVALARRVRERRSDIEFTFSLKPECFTPEFAALGSPGVDVRSGGASFIDELSAFDGFLSPVTEARSTPAPPLTWLEAFAAGVPVITTFHSGVDEVVRQDRSGIVARDYQELETKLLNRSLKAQLQVMRASARREHAERFDIRLVARRYADVYRTLFSEMS